MDKNNPKTFEGRGILIVYEGICGSGKSERIKHVFKMLNKKGIKVKILEWNSNRVIRSFVNKLNDMGILGPVTYSILQWVSFIIDYCTKLVPSLKKGQVVIADRYIYTGATRDAVNGAFKFPGHSLLKLMRKPDLLFFYDIPVEICYERMKARRKALFHTNKIILKSRLLKNKDLYYLKKLRNEYIRLLNDMKAREGGHIMSLDENLIDADIDSIERYINRKEKTFL